MLESVVSPYEFHARAIGVYTALTLSDLVLTAMPTDGAGDTSSIRPEDLPRTLETAREWAWSSALWREGVLLAGLAEASPLEDVGEVCDEIEAVDAWSDIRPMIDTRLFDDTRARLEAISRDLKHGGINPGVSVPVSCGIARYAGRHGLLMFRSPAASTVTKLEARGTTTSARCAVSVFDGIDGETLIAVRETLNDALVPLREAILETNETARSVGVQDTDLVALEREVLQPAAAAYEQAFTAHKRVLSERAEDEGCRYRVRTVTLSFGHADPDGVLLAAATAARSLRTRAASALPNPVLASPGGVIGRRALSVCSVGVRRLEAVLV